MEKLGVGISLKLSGQEAEGSFAMCSRPACATQQDPVFKNPLPGTRVMPPAKDLGSIPSPHRGSSQLSIASSGDGL